MTLTAFIPARQVERKKEGRPPNPTLSEMVTCENCGKLIRSYYSHQRRKRFCSRRCVAEFSRKGVFCRQCHQPIPSPRSWGRQYCSKQCYHKSRTLTLGEAHKHEVIQTYKRRAKSRHLAWMLSDVEVESLLSGDCHYCGDAPSNGTKSKRGERHNGVLTYNGIDRVDSSLGYTKGNCVSCCRMCNLMKLNFPKDVFLAKVGRIALTWKLNRTW